jgi:hypothetical protein
MKYWFTSLLLRLLKPVVEVTEAGVKVYFRDSRVYMNTERWDKEIFVDERVTLNSFRDFRF